MLDIICLKLIKLILEQVIILIEYKLYIPTGDNNIYIVFFFMILLNVDFHILQTSEI